MPLIAAMLSYDAGLPSVLIHLFVVTAQGQRLCAEDLTERTNLCCDGFPCSRILLILQVGAKVLERYLVLLEGCLVVPSIVLSHSLLHVLCTQAISSLVGPPPPASAEVRAARSGSIPPLLIKSVIDVVMSMLKCILADQGSMLSDIPIARSLKLLYMAPLQAWHD